MTPEQALEVIQAVLLNQNVRGFNAIEVLKVQEAIIALKKHLEKPVQE